MAEQYILQNLPTATVKSTAQYLNVSERTLLNLFQFMLGMPTVEYIQKRKIDEACRQLSFGENTIGEIAEDLGYADQFVFSKAFSKYMGISPSKYRKQEYLLKYTV
ncbi:MAG: AraC family transcriptional regulator [Fusicatenibacter sp.]|nr:AraC family transcriptional regulator [Fusicatenibacter sp.]